MASFALGTIVAELAGASSLGVAVSFGQIAAVAALMVTLLTR